VWNGSDASKDIAIPFTECCLVEVLGFDAGLRHGFWLVSANHYGPMEKPRVVMLRLVVRMSGCGVARINCLTSLLLPSMIQSLCHSCTNSTLARLGSKLSSLANVSSSISDSRVHLGSGA
jgi:hypothetical protein